MNSELLPKIIPTTHCIFILTNWLHRTIHSLVILTIQVLLFLSKFLSHSYDITWSTLKITLEYCAKVAYLSTIYKYWRYLVIMKNTDASICSKSFWKLIIERTFLKWILLYFLHIIVKCHFWAEYSPAALPIHVPAGKNVSCSPVCPFSSSKPWSTVILLV